MQPRIVFNPPSKLPALKIKRISFFLSNIHGTPSRLKSVVLPKQLEPLLDQTKSMAQGKLVINWEPILILIMKNMLFVGLYIFFFNLYLDKKKQTTVEISEGSVPST